MDTFDEEHDIEDEDIVRQYSEGELAKTAHQTLFNIYILSRLYIKQHKGSKRARETRDKAVAALNQRTPIQKFILYSNLHERFWEKDSDFQVYRKNILCRPDTLDIPEQPEGSTEQHFERLVDLSTRFIEKGLRCREEREIGRLIDALQQETKRDLDEFRGTLDDNLKRFFTAKVYTPDGKKGKVLYYDTYVWPEEVKTFVNLNILMNYRGCIGKALLDGRKPDAKKLNGFIQQLKGLHPLEKCAIYDRSMERFREEILGRPDHTDVPDTPATIPDMYQRYTHLITLYIERGLTCAEEYETVKLEATLTRTPGNDRKKYLATLEGDLKDLFIATMCQDDTYKAAGDPHGERMAAFMREMMPKHIPLGILPDRWLC